MENCCVCGNQAEGTYNDKNLGKLSVCFQCYYLGLLLDWLNMNEYQNPYIEIEEANKR